MNNNEMLIKLFNNKKLLFFIPSFLYTSLLLFIYNQNCGINGDKYEILLKDVCINITIYLIIHLIIHSALKVIIQDSKKICVVEILIFIVMYIITNLSSEIFYIIIGILIIVSLISTIFFIRINKFNKSEDMTNFIGIISYIIAMIFIFNLILCVKNEITILIKTKSYNETKKFIVTETDKKPNIYWIHCDGMLGISAMEKYFNYSDPTLLSYFNHNNYYVNKEATLVAAHYTRHALVALLNPDYYDNFQKQYLLEIEDVYIEKKNNPSYIINYENLTEKRLNNELMNAFKKNNYTTVSISEFNQYTSLYTDYMFDYYDYNAPFDSKLETIKYMKKEDVSINDLKHYNDFIQFANIPSILNNNLKKINFLNYEEITYDNMDYSQYPAIKNSTYLTSKMILKSLDISTSIKETNKLTFINYLLNHLPIKFDHSGNRISGNYDSNLNYYLENYEYSSLILIDILNFIKDNDKEAVIIVQADHGIHNVKEEIIMEQLNITKEEVPAIRNSVISAIYIPEQYKNGEEQYLNNPLNISRYLVNNFVGENYEYITE